MKNLSNQKTYGILLLTCTDIQQNDSMGDLSVDTTILSEKLEINQLVAEQKSKLMEELQGHFLPVCHRFLESFLEEKFKTSWWDELMFPLKRGDTSHICNGKIESLDILDGLKVLAFDGHLRRDAFGKEGRKINGLAKALRQERNDACHHTLIYDYTEKGKSDYECALATIVWLENLLAFQYAKLNGQPAPESVSITVMRLVQGASRDLDDNQSNKINPNLAKKISKEIVENSVELFGREFNVIKEYMEITRKEANTSTTMTHEKLEVIDGAVTSVEQKLETMHNDMIKFHENFQTSEDESGGRLARQRTNTEDSPEVRDKRNNAKSFINKGNYTDGLIYYAEVLKQQKKELGEDHSNIADTHSLIGWVYHEAGSKVKDSDKNGIFAFRESLRILDSWEKEPDDDIKVANAYRGLGSIFFNQKNYREALDYFEKALAILEEKWGNKGKLSKIGFGKIDPRLKKIYTNLADTYAKIPGGQAEAKKFRNLADRCK